MLDGERMPAPNPLRRLGLTLLVVAVATDLVSVTVGQWRAMVHARLARSFDDLVPEENMLLEVAMAILDASDR